MRRKKLSVTLTGSDADGGDVVLDDLRGFCAALTTCLRTIEKKLEAGTRLDYRIVGLRRGSCGMTILPTADTMDMGIGTEVLDFFTDTVKALEKNQPVDHRLDSHDLMAFKKLADPFKGKIRSIKIGRFSITGKYVETINTILDQPAVADGEATGVLEKLDVHDKSTFTLFPNIGGPITCHFDDSLLDHVKAAIKRNITIYGRLMYYLGSPFPGKAEVRKIDIHPPDDELPSLMDLRGLMANGSRHG